MREWVNFRMKQVLIFLKKELHEQERIHSQKTMKQYRETAVEDVTT